MAALKSKPLGATYRFQRHHPSLMTGDYLTTKQKREEPMRVFFSQSDIDGACGLHTLSAALVILGLAKSSALTEMSRRKHGVPAAVWAAFRHTYFNGVNPPEFVELVKSLELPIHVTARHGHAEGVDAVALDSLMHGDLVAVAFESVANSRTRHWALAVGIEGTCIARKEIPDTILLLDPGAAEPHFGVANARLTALPGATDRARTKLLVWAYESPCWPTEQVRLLSAVRFKPETWP